MVRQKIAKLMGGSVRQPQCQDEKRALETLLSNSLVNGDREIGEAIIACGQHFMCEKNSTFIKQGASDDYAYFLLSGEVRFLVNGRDVGGCSVPRSVGELSANKPGQPRTADVRSASELVEAWKISGSDFREIRDSFPSFKSRLNVMIEEMNRQKIAQLGTSDTKSKSWLWISVFAAIFGAVFFGMLAYYFQSAPPLVFCSVIAGAVLCLVICSILNPEYWYRRVAAFSSFALVALIIYGGISFQFTTGNEAGAKWLLDFSKSSDLSLGHLLISFVILLGVISINIFADLRSRK